ncbi:MAG TPA: glycosyltransferase [Pirellulales bacterium]|jgi:glycosyltransferase involved in cell wall biosynthesis|nr:glycosyltransferase [Pirellulales bacterium]
MNDRLTCFELSSADTMPGRGDLEQALPLVLSPESPNATGERTWQADCRKITGYRETRLVVEATNAKACSVRAYLVGDERGPAWVAAEVDPSAVEFDLGYDGLVGAGPELPKAWPARLRVRRVPAAASAIDHSRQPNTAAESNSPASGRQKTIGPRISFCMALKNRGDNFKKMLRAWTEAGDDQCELVVADFGTTDIHLSTVLREQARPYTIVGLTGPFNRARGLNAAAAVASGEILFFIDADMVIPKNFCQTLRQRVLPGWAYFPICYSLHEGSACEGSQPGWWRTSGFGMCGFTAADFRRFRWCEAFTRWGKEDNDIFSRAAGALEIYRDRCPGLFHLWHPDDLEFKERYHATGQGTSLRPALVVGKDSRTAASVANGERKPFQWHVVIPCHNYGRYLTQAVQSVLANDVDLAISIVDDASTDDTAQIAADLVQHDRRVSYLPHRQRLDVSAARNNGIRARASQYVCLLDADDYLGPNYLRSAQSMLEAGIDCVCPDMHLVGDRTAIWQVPERDLATAMLTRNRIAYCSAFARRWWVSLQGFDESLGNWQDYDFWLRMLAQAARFARLPGEHFFYRQHGPSKSLKPDTDQARSAELWRLLRSRHPELSTLGRRV